MSTTQQAIAVRRKARQNKRYIGRSRQDAARRALKLREMILAEQRRKVKR